MSLAPALASVTPAPVVPAQAALAPPKTYSQAAALLRAPGGLGVVNWATRFGSRRQRPIERAITDAVSRLTAAGRSAALLVLVLRAVLASLPDVAEELLARYGPLHALDSALLCADIVWADDDQVIRAEVEGKSRGASGNWVDVEGILARLDAGQLVWRIDAAAQRFRAGMASYAARRACLSQAEFPCWTPRAYVDAGYVVDPATGTHLVLWTAAPRRGPQQTWRDAEHAYRWDTARWSATFAYLHAALGDPVSLKGLTNTDIADLADLTRMLGSA